MKPILRVVTSIVCLVFFFSNGYARSYDGPLIQNHMARMKAKEDRAVTQEAKKQAERAQAIRVFCAKRYEKFKDYRDCVVNRTSQLTQTNKGKSKSRTVRNHRTM